MASIPTVTTAVNTVRKGEHYQVLGSHGNWYDIAVQRDGSLACNCMAGQYRKPCKHTPQVQAVLAADNWQAFAARVNERAIAKGIVSSERVASEQAQASEQREQVARGEYRTHRAEGGTVYTASSIADELCGA